MFGISSFLNGMDETYHPLSESTSIDFSKYSQSSENLTEYLRTGPDSVESQTVNVTARSKIGQAVDFFEGGYKVFMSIPKSFGFVSDITSGTMDGLNVGGSGFFNVLKGGLIAIMFIMIFIGVIWAVLVRREELWLTT